MKIHKSSTKIVLVLMLLVTMLVNGNVVGATSTAQDIDNADALMQPGSYRLTGDITLPKTMTIEQNQSYYIDLNGYTITSEVKTSATEITNMFVNSGTLTIDDTSSNKKGMISSNALFGIVNYGNLTIVDGNFKSDVVGKNITNDGKYNARIIRNEGSLIIHEGNFDAAGGAINTRVGSSTVINGGTFVSTSSNQSMVDNEKDYYTYCVTNNGKMIINNATIKGIQGALSSSAGELYVYDGDFSTDWSKSNSFYALYIAGEVDKSKGYIYGGNYSSKRSAAYIGNSADGGAKKEATVSIYGGSFVGGEKAIYLDHETTSDPLIQGGSYFTATSPISEKSIFTKIKDYLNEDYKLNEITGEVIKKYADSLILNETRMVLEVGTKQTLTATLTPSDVYYNEVTWSSTKPEVATVNNNGVVIAKAPGSTNIVVTDNNKTAICEVTVYKKEVIEPPKIDPTQPVKEVSVGINDTVSLEHTIQALFQGNNAAFVSDATYNNILRVTEAGESVSVSMDFDRIQEASLTAATVNKFYEQADLVAGENGTAVIAQYLDLSIQLIAGDEKLGKLNQLVEPLVFSIALPEALVEANREYYVLRLHEGEVTALPATLNGTTLTFETDQFSTFALVYIDKSTSTTPDTGSTNHPSISPVKKVNTGVASANIGGYIFMMGISLTIIITFRKKLQSK